MLMLLLTLTLTLMLKMKGRGFVTKPASAKIITIGNRKGGIGKTTTTASLAFILNAVDKRVLVVDMDSQGHIIKIFTAKDADEFAGKTVLEAMKSGNAEPFIHRFEYLNNIDILPSNGALATFGMWADANSDRGFERAKALKIALDKVKHKYDFILIDTPPALGDEVINALVASTHVIGCTEFSHPSIDNLKDFFNIVKNVQESSDPTQPPLNPDLEILGIVSNLFDVRVKHHKLLQVKLRGLYGDLVFKSIIKEAASTERLFGLGFSEEENGELVDAVDCFFNLVKEVQDRVEAQ